MLLSYLCKLLQSFEKNMHSEEGFFRIIVTDYTESVSATGPVHLQLRIRGFPLILPNGMLLLRMLQLSRMYSHYWWEVFFTSEWTLHFRNVRNETRDICEAYCTSSKQIWQADKHTGRQLAPAVTQPLTICCMDITMVTLSPVI